MLAPAAAVAHGHVKDQPFDIAHIEMHANQDDMADRIASPAPSGAAQRARRTGKHSVAAGQTALRNQLMLDFGPARPPPLATATTAFMANSLCASITAGIMASCRSAMSMPTGKARRPVFSVDDKRHGNPS